MERGAGARARRTGPGCERKELGQEAEEMAAGFMAGRGYRILARNFRTRLGEVDLIAEKGGQLVFVEVRYRRSMVFGSPKETVGPPKRRRVVLAAMEWAADRRRLDQAIRFDVVSVVSRAGRPLIEHVEDAFDAELPEGSVPVLL